MSPDAAHGEPTGRVLVVGDIVTDIVAVHRGPVAVDSDTPARITTTAGGSAANTAAWLAYAGTTVDLLGVVGADPAGEERVAELAAGGVGCSRVVRSRTAATASVIVLTDGRHRTMITDRGANHELRPSDVDDALAALPDVAHVHLSGYTLLDETSRPAGLRALAAASSRGVPTSVDAASAAPLRAAGAFLDWAARADLLLANLDEAAALASTVEDDPMAVAAALAHRVREVVVKLGPGGAVWARGHDVRVVAARPARVVDTTGAGDAFAAGLLAARIAGAGVDAALAEAVRLGALAVGQLGGRPPRAPPE
jgi:sugar/nucleoside kinase (ribokinase family)